MGLCGCRFRKRIRLGMIIRIDMLRLENDLRIIYATQELRIDSRSTSLPLPHPTQLTR